MADKDVPVDPWSSSDRWGGGTQADAADDDSHVTPAQVLMRQLAATAAISRPRVRPRTPGDVSPLGQDLAEPR